MLNTLTVALALVAAQPAPPVQPSNSPVLENCHVALIDDVEVPAQEPGVIVELNVREGQTVKAGEVLGHIDDSQAQGAKLIAEYDFKAATEKAKADVEIRYAKAAYDVAKAEYEKALAGEGRVRGAIGEAELNRLKLTARRAELQIEQAYVQRTIDDLTAKTKGAESDVASKNVERRLIRSPIDGVVVAVNRHVGEWTQPGDVVLQVVQIDKLRVEGYANISQHNPVKINGKAVQIETQLETGDRPTVFNGRITFVDPRVQAGGFYRVFAEVDNREQNGEWLLRPGLIAAMAIDNGVAAARPALPVPATRAMK